MEPTAPPVSLPPQQGPYTGPLPHVYPNLYGPGSPYHDLSVHGKIFHFLRLNMLRKRIKSDDLCYIGFAHSHDVKHRRSVYAVVVLFILWQRFSLLNKVPKRALFLNYHFDTNSFPIKVKVCCITCCAGESYLVISWLQVKEETARHPLMTRLYVIRQAFWRSQVEAGFLMQIQWLTPPDVHIFTDTRVHLW